MPANPPSFALTGAILFTGEAFVENQALLVQGDTILDLCPASKIPDGSEAIAVDHGILTAGYIDCQVNGGGNVLLNNDPTAEGALKIAAAHRKTGTTSLLPTCITDGPDKIKAAIEAVAAARQADPSILGIHVEGPHINEAYQGTHNAAFVRPMTDEDLALYHPVKDGVFLLTLAPEKVSPAQIKQLVAQGVIVSMGHTNATAEQVYAALGAGAHAVTHLFNRMPPITSRIPSLTGIALDCVDCWAGLIADDVHVAQELVRLAVRAKQGDKLFMVSDSLSPAGADDPQSFDWNGIKVFPKEKVCVNEHGVIAGAILTLGQCVPVAIRDIRLDPAQVLRMASTIPAAFLGKGDSLGKLLPGYKADIVALDHGFNAKRVWKNGVEQ